MNELKQKFFRVVNEILPRGHQLVDLYSSSEKVSDVISEKYDNISNDFKSNFPFRSSTQEITRGNKINVENNKDKQFLVESGWFSDEEKFSITETRKMAEADAKAIQEGVEEVVESLLNIRYANNYREMNDLQIRLAQDACYARLKTDPIFFGAIKQLMNYIAGEGVSYSCQIPEITDILDDFYRINHFDVETSLIDRMVLRHLLEGDQFVYLESDKGNGDCFLTFLENYEIVDWEFHPRWRDIVLAYKFSNGSDTFWVADYRYFDEIYNSTGLLKATSQFHDKLDENKFIIHIKENIYPEFRGRPLATAALRYFKFAEDFLYDRVILNHERSRVVWIRKILGRAASNLANFLAAPPSGVMLNQTEDISYDVMNSEINADDVKQDYLHIMYAIASCFMMPIHVLNMRANEQVYASVLSAKAPFTKAIIKWQDFFSRALYKIHKVVIREKVKVRDLKPSYTINVIVNSIEVKKTLATINIPVTHIFPNPVDEKLLERTKHEEFLVVNRIASMQTIREKNGFNNQEELRRLSEEKNEWTEITKMKTKQLDKPPSDSSGGGK